MNYVLILIWMITLVPLIFIPYSIAVFYQRSFRRKTYSWLFILSLLLLAAGYVNPSFSYGMLFFAIGGILLGGASLRLDQVMIGRGK